jgi:hypothetical protein
VSSSHDSRRRAQPERHQPLPGLPGLARFLLRRTPRIGRIALALLAVVAVAGAIYAAPRISSGKRERARTEKQAQTTARARERRRLAADQAPRRAVAPAGSLAAQVGALEAAVTRDVHARQRGRLLPGPRVGSTQCTPPVDQPNASRVARRRGGVIERCIAYTTRRKTADGRSYGTGFEFVAVIDRRGRRLTWCKTNPAAGEKFGGVSEASVPLARACTDPRA